MILLSESTVEKGRRLMKDFEAGRLAPEDFGRRMIELDPHDFPALVALGRFAAIGGDREKAEEYFRKAIEANPVDGAAYMELSRVYFERGHMDLSRGFSELGFRNLARSGQDLGAAIDSAFDGVDPAISRELAALSSEERQSIFLSTMKKERNQEPPDVSKRLRPLRMIDRLRENENLSADEVDEILSEGRVMIPLLIGVLRAWARDYLEDDAEFVMENAAAILGEMGSPEEIPALLDLIGLEGQGPAGVAAWAVNRIVDRNPGDAQAYFEKNIDSLGMVGMMELADLAMHNSEFDSSGRLLKLAGDRCQNLDKNVREQFLSLLMIAVSTRGPDGLESAREMLHRNSGALPWKSRGRCEELMSILEKHGTPDVAPRRSSYTVYEICGGEASWDDDEHEDAGQEDDELPEVPAPARKGRGRNDPCWCGSGKKYKKCHLDSDAKGESEKPVKAAKTGSDAAEFDGLRKRIGELLWMMPQRELKRAAEEFACEDAPEDTNGLALSDWLVHDWIPPGLGHTVLRQFLARNGNRLTPREKELVEAWSRSHVGLYETREVTRGKGVEVTDLIFGDTFFVHDISMSNSLAKWDALFARRVLGERGTEFTGAGVSVPRTQLQAVREWLEEDRAKSKLEWSAYLKTNWPRIRRRAIAIGVNWMDSLRLSNTDGEELLFCKSTYEVVDRSAALAGLHGCAELMASSEAGEEPWFTWLDPKKTVIANIRIKSHEAVLEANSRQRLERAKALIAGATGEALRHRRDEITTQKALRENARDRTDKPAVKANAIPKERERELLTAVLEQHYAKWSDMPLPALDGMTPREAAKTSEGRRQLAELLKFIENGEERKRLNGDAFYDASKLRRELGV